MSDKQVLEFRYAYEFEDGAKREFEIRIDESTMGLVLPGRAEYPPWTELGCCRCPNCPLDEAAHARCPSAVALVDVVDFCKDRISHEKVSARVEARNRSYARSTTLYQALSSLIGIIMATGGCPVMERLRPMARFHLPFADDDETMYRAMSAYLLGQYFIMKKGVGPDWSMEKLVGMYDGIREVNRSFCDRLRTVSSKDSNINAVIGLDCFADLVIFSISERFMDQLDILYRPYLERAAAAGLLPAGGERPDMDQGMLKFRYAFRFGDGLSRQFDIAVDRQAMDLVRPERAGFPAWAALDFHRCPNCPLEQARHAYCPSAMALVDVVELCRDRYSYEEVLVAVDGPNRSYSRRAPLHVSLSSLIGLYMATGGCPVMERLKPMARFHLPFADEDETMFRAMSAYLLGQYFIVKEGGEPDWSMEKLAGMYDRIKAVNRSFCDRVRAISTKDSNVSAVIGLDCFADAVIFSINQHFMDQLEQLYRPYLP